MLKDKIISKQKTVGMHVSLSDPISAAIVGKAGYDFIWVDLEHSPVGFTTLLNHITAIKAGGTPVIVRVPQNDLTYTKKVLEMGVDGIIFPMVKSAKEANEQISWTLYPPEGTRGFGPMGAVNYGDISTSEYIRINKSNLCRFIQIEHKNAVEDIENIIKNPYIDGYIFGPCDLSGSYGIPGQVFSDTITEVIRSTAKMLHANGKYVGLSTFDIETDIFEHWKSLGIDMLSAGSDYDFIRRVSKYNLKNLTEIFK